MIFIQAIIHINEHGVDVAKKSDIPRNVIWITSKVLATEFDKGNATDAIEKMLKRLDRENLDLVL